MLRAITFNGIPITPSSISLPSGGSFDLYNTADQTTNYERLRADWSGNVARIYTTAGGTGTARAIAFGAISGVGNSPVNLIVIKRSTAPFVQLTSDLTGLTGALFQADGALSASSGTQGSLAVAPTINQSGTAGYIALDVNPTETATGSGTKLLQRWAVGGTPLATIDNTGNLRTASGQYVGGLFGFSSGIAGTIDVILARDAAATLGLRNGTNAQTFRVYKTYTDASNYERLDVGWSGSQCFIGAAFAGTGSGRELQFVSYGSAAFTLTATAHMALAAGTTARSQINFASSTAPTSPADGDLWFDGTNLKLRVSGATYTLTKT